MKKSLLIATLIVLSLVAAACGGSDDPDTNATEQPETAEGAASETHGQAIEGETVAAASGVARVDGTSWKLLGFQNGDLFDRVGVLIDITIMFDGDQVSGSTACNAYMGTASPDGSLLFGPIGTTKKLCAPQIMTFEDRYLAALSNVDSLVVTADDRMVLAPATGESLVFARA